MRGKGLSLGLVAALAIFAAGLLLTGARAVAQTEKVLFTFTGIDGDHPMASLLTDAAGNLYGAADGGTYVGPGVVFELMPRAGGGWKEKVLFNFNGTDGSGPQSVIFDAAGNIYGESNGGGHYGDGTVFKLAHGSGGSWTATVLHSFGSSGDGLGLSGNLAFDATGNLYGTTVQGGAYNYGTVFELVRKAGGGWGEKILHSFNDNGTDGWWPTSGVTLDAAGNLYGTTSLGGNGCVAPGCGTVFELTPTRSGAWTETVLYDFGSNIADGSGPGAGLIFDAAGNLYGTTGGGGAYGNGTVFELTPAGGSWTETVLYSFDNNGVDGFSPRAGLIRDGAGNLYGTTFDGGIYGVGTVFQLTPATGGGWTEKVLHSFTYNPHNGSKDGANPEAGLIFDTAGNLYGTTFNGGTPNEGGLGTVFEITP